MVRWFSLVAVLVLFVSLLPAFSQNAQPAPAGKELSPGISEETFKTLDAMVDKALDGYNNADTKVFYADFAKSMAAIATDQAFQTLYKDNYMTNFGKYKSKKFDPAKSVLSDGMGLLSYTAEFEKNAKMTVSVNIMKEEDKLLFMQIQFNPAP